MPPFPLSGPQYHSTIAELVETRRCTLHISKVGLVKRMGYANTNKGLRNFEDFLDGDFEQPFIADNLSTVLAIDPNQIDQAIAETKRNITIAKLNDTMHEAQNWARTFKVHAVIDTENDCPSPIFVAAMFDTARLKVIDLDTSQYAVTYFQQALCELPNRLDSSGSIPAFGAPVGITINIGPEMSIKHDLLGKEIERSNWVDRIRLATMEY